MRDRQSELDRLHRDAGGNGLLVGPDCPDCERAAVARYRCTSCDLVVEVPGVYRWFWQGRGHWHVAEDPDALTATLSEHQAAHGGCFLPVETK